MITVPRLFLALAMFCAVTEASAQAWPARPVRFIISQAAGTAPDVVCRVVVDRLGSALGQSVIVDNRGGGGNVIGTTVAATSAPDGYTFYFGTGAGLVTNLYTFKSLPYDPVKDFTPVAMVGKSAFMLVGRRDLPAQSLAEVIALDRAQPGKLTVAITGPKMFSGILGAYLNKVAGTSMLLVAFNSNAQGLQDTIAGRIDLNIQATTPVVPFVRNGELKPIAVSSAGRQSGLEQIPAIAETLPNFEFVGWFAVVAPTGTPAEPIRRINREFDRILKDPEVVARLLSLGLYTDGANTPEGLGVFFANERERWSQIVKQIGIEPD